MRNFLLSIFILICFINPGFSQKKGYIGRIHHVQFDVAGMLLGQYKMEYKLSLGKHFAIAATGGIQKNQVQFVNKEILNPISHQYVPVASASFSGKMWGLGIAYNSPMAGLSMPMGFYSGIYYQRLGGMMEDYYNGKVLRNNYSVKSNIFKCYIGKSIQVYQFLTLDLGIGLGFVKGNITGENPDIAPSVQLPNYNFFSSFIGGEDNDDNYGNGYTRSSFLKFYAIPEVKIGYLF